MPPYLFPTHILNPDPVSAGIRAKVISGGTALNDDETVIQPDAGGRVEIIYGEMDLDDPLARRVWGVWSDYLEGGARVVLVPIANLELAPIPPGASSTFVYNDDYFATSWGFSPGYVIAETVGSASLRDTTITIDVTQGDDLKPGTWFSIGYRAYKIRRIISVVGTQYTVEFSPPLRGDVADGTGVVFDWPVVQCRAVLGQDLIPSISQGKYGTVSVAFVEDFSTVTP